jgi:hypothetical protein
MVLSAQKPQGSEPPSQTHPMAGMMKECRQRCQATQASIDQLSKSLEEARHSNDPAKMRAAIDRAQKPLQEMRDHMAGCMNMMQMMQNMHGGRMGGRMGERGGSEQKQKTPESGKNQPQ